VLAKMGVGSAAELARAATALGLAIDDRPRKPR
jgi:hypothetical protein